MRNTPSAIGDRQMLPMQTNSTFAEVCLSTYLLVHCRGRIHAVGGGASDSITDRCRRAESSSAWPVALSPSLNTSRDCSAVDAADTAALKSSSANATACSNRPRADFFLAL